MRPDNDYTHTVADKSEEPLASKLTLSEAWQGFLSFKSDWAPKIRQGNEKYYEVIEAVLGQILKLLILLDVISKTCLR